MSTKETYSLEFIAVCKEHGFDNHCRVYSGWPLENILSGDFVVACGCSEFSHIKNVERVSEGD